MLRRSLNASIITAIAAGLLPVAAQAQWWRRHPAYLHAMSNLRMAYWLVAHHGPGDPAARAEENFALRQIRAAYLELKTAAIVDDLDIDAQPPAGTTFYDHRGRLHRALDLLQQAHNQVDREEEDPASHGLKNRALQRIDAAAAATSAAIQAWSF